MTSNHTLPPDRGALVETRSNKGNLLERAVGQLLLRKANVVGVSDLSPNFRLIDLQGAALMGCAWTPGDKIQIRLDGRGFLNRTYTPLHWDKIDGRTQLLAYCHGAGPGSDWARTVEVGDERQLFGPRRSISLEGIGSDAILFGDETSFALASAFEQCSAASAARRYVFEVANEPESAAVLQEMGIVAPSLFKKGGTDDYMDALIHRMLASSTSTTTFILTGKATSIQQVSRALKVNGVSTKSLRTKAYWALGKVGLD